jgi:hypothetical protein
MPETPDSTPTPKSRPKKKSPDARKAEADGFIDIEQCGVALRIPLGEKVPLAAYMAFRADDEMRGTELLLGAEQWQAFMDANPTVGDFAEIGQKLTEVLGN